MHANPENKNNPPTYKDTNPEIRLLHFWNFNFESIFEFGKKVVVVFTYYFNEILNKINPPVKAMASTNKNLSVLKN